MKGNIFSSNAVASFNIKTVLVNDDTMFRLDFKGTMNFSHNFYWHHGYQILIAKVMNFESLEVSIRGDIPRRGMFFEGGSYPSAHYG